MPEFTSPAPIYGDPEPFVYTTIPGEPTEPGEAIGAWREAATRAGYLPVGNATVEESPEFGGVLRVTGPVKSLLTAPERADLDNWFSYHAPSGPSDIAAYQEIRDAGHAFAMVLLRLVPGSRERSNAWSAIREAVMWANAGRACNAPAVAPHVEGTAGAMVNSAALREAVADTRATIDGTAL